MRVFLTLSALVLGSLSFIHAAHAEDKSPTQIVLETVFNEAEKAVIEDYYGKHKDAKDAQEHEHGKSKGKDKKNGAAKSMPPGLAKRDELPPGLQKHLEKNGTLPPGLEGRDLPDDLKEKLPKTREGTKRIIVDNDVVLIEEGTRKVLDIIKDVLAPPSDK